MDFATRQPLLAGLSGLRARTSLPRLVTGLPDTLARAAVELQLDPEAVEAELNTLVPGSAYIPGCSSTTSPTSTSWTIYRCDASSNG